MAENREKVIQEIDGDLTSLNEKVNLLRNTLNETRDEFSDGSSLNTPLSEGLQQAESALNDLEARLNSLERKTNTAKKYADSETQNNIQNQAAQLTNVFHTLEKEIDFSKAATATGMQFAKSLEDSIKNELTRYAPAIANTVRTVFGSQPFYSSMKRNVDAVMQAPSMREISRQFTMDGGGQALTQYTEHIIRSFFGASATDSRQGKNVSQYDLFPQILKDTWDHEGKKYTSSFSTHQEDILSDEAAKKLRHLIATNSGAKRAAINVQGMTRTNEDGSISVNGIINGKMLDAFTENLVNDYLNRIQGMPSRRIDLNGVLDDRDLQLIKSRGLSGTAGISLSAVDAVENIARNGNWRTRKSEDRDVWRGINDTTKTNLKMFEISKYSMEDLINGIEKAEGTKVALQQSQATDMLGLTEHNSATDKIIEISLNGFKKNDEKQVKAQTRLHNQGIKIGERHYTLANLHGTGAETLLTLVDDKQRKILNENIRKRAQEAGLNLPEGDFFDLLTPREHSFENIEEYSRFIDAMQKVWSPGHKIDSNLSSKNFAFINARSRDGLKKLADGIGWVANSVMPHTSAQARFAQGGKGGQHQLGYDSIGAYADAIGMREEIAALAGVQPAVLDRIHGLMDESQQKNLGIFDSDAQKRNDQLTGLIRIFGLYEMKSETESDAHSIGRQAMQFLHFDNKEAMQIRAEQARDAMAKIRSLRSEAGREAFILSDPESALAKRFASGEITANDPEVRRKADEEIIHIINALSQGQYTNYDPDSSVQSKVLQRSLFSVLIQNLWVQGKTDRTSMTAGTMRAVYVSYSNVSVSTCTFTYFNYVFASAGQGQIYTNNCIGGTSNTSDGYATAQNNLVAYAGGGGTIVLTGTYPFGKTTSNTANGAGVVRIATGATQTAADGSGSVPDVPDTTSFTASNSYRCLWNGSAGSGAYVSGAGWGSASPMKGKNSSAATGNVTDPHYFGIWVFSSADRTAMKTAAASAKSISVTITRSYAYGSDGAVPVTLYYHAQTGKPADSVHPADILTSVGTSKSIKRGESATFTLTAAQITAMKNGTITGFGVSSAANAQLAQFMSDGCVIDVST